MSLYASLHIENKFASLTFFAYNCPVIKTNDDMTNNIRNSDILYVNKLTNVIYQDGEILETSVKKDKKDTQRDTIFDIYARMLVKSSEQRKVLYHIIFDKEEYTRNKLSIKLSQLYGKSSRTYERAIDYLFGRRIIRADRHKILKVTIEYDLSLLDLDSVKSIIIHIN